MFEWITDPNAWLALGTLTILEVVLGIDNIIFLSLVVAKLPKHQQASARRLGLMGAMLMRLARLASIAWVARLTDPLFTLFDHAFSWRDLILLGGGLFLLWKNAIRWHIPAAMLLSLGVCATLGWLISPESLNTPLIHLFSGATMLGAFFIATDPVTASTTNRGRLLYGALIGLLVWLIRSFGGYPDGVAFAVLLANICVPLIDYYTQPRVYGHRKE